VAQQGQHHVEVLRLEGDLAVGDLLHFRFLEMRNRVLMLEQDCQRKQEFFILEMRNCE
jgi:hypothetical protein